MSEHDGGPAFPTHKVLPDQGMSLRDYFAAQALLGIVGSPNYEWFTSDDTGSRTLSAAYLAYSFADAMLAARKLAGGENA